MAPKRQYWWIVTRDPDTRKPYLVFGSDRDEAEAREKALTMLGGLDFEIRRYATRDLGTASAYYRGKRLEDGEGLKASSERIGHGKSIARMRKRRRAPAISSWE
jgi:hypothetical protein